MRKWIIVALILLGGVYFIKQKQAAEEEAATPRPTLIPRDVLLGTFDHVGVRISPDGRYLAYRAPYEGILNIWVEDLEKGTPPKPYTFDKGRGVRGFHWTYKEDTLLYAHDEGGDENYRYYKLDIKTGKSTLVTPGKKVQARVAKTHHTKPNKVMMMLNTRDPQYHDLYELDLETDKLTLVYENREFLELILDHNFNVRFAVKLGKNASTVYLIRQDTQWKEYRSLGPADILSTQLLGFNKTGTFIYWLDGTKDDKAALVEMNVETKAVKKLFVPKHGDLSSALIHPIEKNILAVTEHYLKKDQVVLDESIQGDFDYLKGIDSGVFQVLDATLEFNKWVVVYYGDNHSPRYYLYDRLQKQARYLFPMQKALENYTLAKQHALEIKARDGLTLPAYLTLPVETKLRAEGRPVDPLPMVLIVHGGPHARDAWDHEGLTSIESQMFANRGYAVLRVNYRGSLGFGKNFVNAGNGEYGAKMHDDLIDAVNWAIREKIADPKKIAIYGGSYGGYATLVGLTFTPNVFACGVDVVGMSNLVTTLETIPEYWKPAMEFFELRIGGDIRTEEGRSFLRSRSPIHFTHRINKPLLIVHGANDPRVKKAEADQIVDAMKQHNIPVTYVLYPDEGHGFASPTNRVSFYGVAEQFLAQNLGGRFEPLGDDLKKSSAEILEGRLH